MAETKTKTQGVLPSPEQFEALPPEREQALVQGMNGVESFSRLLGLEVEEIRREYARMRMPYKPALNQPAGVVHGGAIASLIDTAVVGAIFSTMEAIPRKLLTIDIHIHYMDAAVEEDVIAHAWVRRRGRSTIFLAVDTFTASGKEVAHGELSYRIVV